MYARMAKFEGLESNQIDEALAEISRRTEAGPPEGVPATEVLFLVDRNSGELTALSLFESEEDMRTGDATLRQMTPPPAMQQRGADVRMYEVALRRP